MLNFSLLAARDLLTCQKHDIGVSGLTLGSGCLNLEQQCVHTHHEAIIFQYPHSTPRLVSLICSSSPPYLNTVWNAFPCSITVKGAARDALRVEHHCHLVARMGKSDAPRGSWAGFLTANLSSLWKAGWNTDWVFYQLIKGVIGCGTDSCRFFWIGRHDDKSICTVFKLPDVESNVIRGYFHS